MALYNPTLHPLSSNSPVHKYAIKSRMNCLFNGIFNKISLLLFLINTDI